MTASWPDAARDDVLVPDQFRGFRIAGP